VSNPPDTCRQCGVYHAFRDGLCLRCIEDNEAAEGDRKADERREALHWDDEC
jgi:hypothetical protein